jgi:hypothetical protein
VTFYVNGKGYTVNLTGRTATLPRNNLTIGNNSIVAVYNGDGNYTTAMAMRNVTVDKYASLVNVSVDNAVYGNHITITVKVGENQTGYVKILVNGEEHIGEIDNGEAVFTIEGLDVKDNYCVNVTYEGNEIYLNNTNHTYFNVTKATVSAEVTARNVTVRENPMFTVNDVTEGFDGNVKIVINGHEYYDGDVKSPIEIAKLTAGKYTANITFYDNKNYNNRSYIRNFTVSRVNVTVTADIADVTYPDNATATVKFSDKVTGTVEILLNGVVIGTETVTDADEISVDLNRLAGGAKEVTVRFTTSDDYHNNATADAKFTVNRASTSVEIVRNGTDVIAVVTPAVAGTVEFYINGETINNATVAGNATIKGKLHIGDNFVVV